MKRIRITCLLIITLIALALPGAVFAQNAPDRDPGPDWNITLEFRYSKGQEGSLNIPQSIARYGRTYHLISKSDPVLEKTLSATREYSWYIDGTVSEAEKGLLDGIDNLEMIPTDVAIGRVVDKHVFEEYVTNDVEDIALTRVIEGVECRRAAVRFEEGDKEFGLPLFYTAEIVYRGIEIYMGPGYKVKASYNTAEDLDGVPVYVVIATYGPDGLAAIGETSGGAGGADGEAAAALAPVDDDFGTVPPVDTGEAAVITDDAVPQAAGDGSAPSVISPLLMALLIAAAAMGGFIAWMFIARSLNKKEKRELREEKRKAVMLSRGLVEYDG